MTSSTYEQLGRFVVEFQHVEAALTEFLVLLSKADDEAVRILANELEFSKRVKTTDVLFAWFVDVHVNTDASAKPAFHRLMAEFTRLGERRNEIVHSKYSDWANIEGAIGLLRQNSRLSSSAGKREEREEELLPQSFSQDFNKLSDAASELERFRLLLIEWLYPVTDK